MENEDKLIPMNRMLRIFNAACLLGFFLCSIPTVEAMLVPTPAEQLPLPLRNNAAECSDPVRNAIGLLNNSKRWGKFEFDCFQGTVLRIQASLRSPIVKQWPKFVSENAVLFDVDPAILTPGEPLGELQSMKVSFHGADILGPFSSGSQSNRIVGDTLVIATDFPKTRSWHFESAISSSAAIKIAEREWAEPDNLTWEEQESGFIAKNMTIAKRTWAWATNSGAHASSAQLVILMANVPCNRCRFDLPSPVWIISAAPDGGSCMINAVTGEACEPCLPTPVTCSL